MQKGGLMWFTRICCEDSSAAAFRVSLSTTLILRDLGGCQNYGPILGTLDNRCRMFFGTQKGILILTTTHFLCS